MHPSHRRWRAADLRLPRKSARRLLWRSRARHPASRATAGRY